jgi:hypothetical protein
MVDKILHRKPTIEQHESNEKRGITLVHQKGLQFLFHCWHPSSYCYMIRTPSEMEFELDTSKYK